MLIYITGFPGVGKLTIARELEQMTDARLIDNHATIDIAKLATEHGSPEYSKLLSKLRDALFATLAKNLLIKNLIFTDALAIELKQDTDRFKKTKQLARKRNEIFVPVFLICEIEENKKRLVAAERMKKEKLTKVNILEDIYAAYTPYQPQDVNGLMIDVTHISSQESAVLIHQHCAKIAKL